MDLRNGDCLEILKDIPSKSVDLVFADLPYGQVNCKWDCKIDLELLWKELLRIAKSDTTPFFFTCTTKFGYELIKSNKKMFKYDLVWAKSNPCGFLQAKKQPMRKHEMVYVFYKKQPAYDISSHKHKFKKEESVEEDKYNVDNYLVKDCGDKKGGTYGREKKPHKSLSYPQKNGESAYDPPLPVSVIKEEQVYIENKKFNTLYGDLNIPDPRRNGKSVREPRYEPPLPVSVIKEEDDYDPSLPHSLLEIKSIRLKQHSTAKPPDLMKWILKYYTKEGDIVLDPTMGSNPMGLACKEMNRNYIGIEKDLEIYKFACSRVE
jgi:DNA modification methylase